MSDDAWFENQYNARSAVPEHVEIFARQAQSSRHVRLRRSCYLDVSYGGGEMEALDVFPSAGPSRAVLSFIHGGYWRSRDKSDLSFVADAFCNAGFTCVLPNYALCPHVTIEHIVRQMLKAHAWLYRTAHLYGGNPARIIVSGHSAGGHLAAMMAACDWPDYEHGLPADLVKAALGISGIYDLMPLRRTSMNADLRLDENAALVASPVTYKPSRGVPMVTAVGGEESNEFRRQCALLRECWPHCVLDAIVVPGLNHFSILDAFARPEGVLFQMVERLADALA
ncbi:MAG: alpha/beta hydrolase [Betaproteobacteria bacterium]|nr:MAG: alpha/beta hydrolase [Betaproteobacteria bacterium]